MPYLGTCLQCQAYFLRENTGHDSHSTRLALFLYLTDISIFIYFKSTRSMWRGTGVLSDTVSERESVSDSPLAPRRAAGSRHSHTESRVYISSGKNGSKCLKRNSLAIGHNIHSTLFDTKLAHLGNPCSLFVLFLRINTITKSVWWGDWSPGNLYVLQ